jgi:hypothetical protein
MAGLRYEVRREASKHFQIRKAKIRKKTEAKQTNENNKTMGRFINRSSSYRSIRGRRCFIGARRPEGKKDGLVGSRQPGEDISDHILVADRHDQKG